jgi:hypothetical protein
MAVAAIGCAAAFTPPVERPSDAERRRIEAAGYEILPIVNADTLVAESLLRGPNHRIAKRVYSDGRRHVYTILSDYGTFHAWGDDMLDARLHEVAVLHAMQKMRATEAFTTATDKARTNTVVARWNLVDEPDDTAAGAPAAAFAAAKAEGAARDEAALSALAGFEAKKRFVAGELGVDPYTSNRALQRELNRLTWNVYAGGLTSMYAPVSRKSESAKDRMHLIVRQYSPAELLRLNRIELRVMGTPEAVIEVFVRNPAYSPRTRTAMIGDLSALVEASDRSAFIEAAATARSEPDARFFQRSAGLLRLHDTSIARLDRLGAIGTTPVGVTKAGTLVVPFPADTTVWSESTAALAASLAHSVPPEFEVVKTELLLSGTASEISRERFEALGVAVVERAFQPEAPPAVKTDADGA